MSRISKKIHTDQNQEKQITYFSNIVKKTILSILILEAAGTGALFLFPRRTYSQITQNPIVIRTIDPSELIMLTNQERNRHELPLLSENPLLTRAAYAKAEDMIEQDYFAHTNPQGRPFYTWVQNVDYLYRSAGENLAIDFTTSEKIIRAWMDSSKHRDNIIHTDYTDIGIAVVRGNMDGHETTVVVQLFGEPFYSAQTRTWGPTAITTPKILSTSHTIPSTGLPYILITLLALSTLLSIGLLCVMLWRERRPRYYTIL